MLHLLGHIFGLNNIQACKPLFGGNLSYYS